MTPRPVRVSDEADADISNAAQWYAERSQRVALAFIEEAHRCFVHIGQFSNGAPRVHGHICQVPMSGFPFIMHYRPMKDHIIVLCLFHTSQDPRKKLRRKR